MGLVPARVLEVLSALSRSHQVELPMESSEAREQRSDAILFGLVTGLLAYFPLHFRFSRVSRPSAVEGQCGY